MRRPSPLRALSRVFRWLGPWAVVLAISLAIAHTAEAVLPPTVTRDLTFETEGVMARVNCPSETNRRDMYVEIGSLQDIQTLEEALCEVRVYPEDQ